MTEGATWFGGAKRVDLGANRQAPFAHAVEFAGADWSGASFAAAVSAGGQDLATITVGSVSFADGVTRLSLSLPQEAVAALPTGREEAVFGWSLKRDATTLLYGDFTVYAPTTRVAVHVVPAEPDPLPDPPPPPPVETPTRTPDAVIKMDEATAKQTILGLQIEGQNSAFGRWNHMFFEPGGYQHDLTPPEMTRANNELAGFGHGFRYFRYAVGNHVQRGVSADRKRLIEHYTTAELAEPGAEQVITTVSQNEQLAAHLKASGFEGLAFEYWAPAPYWMASGALGSSVPSAPAKTSDDPAQNPAYWNWQDGFTDAFIANMQYAAAKHGLPISMAALQNEATNGQASIYSHCNYSAVPHVYVDAMRVLIPKLRAATIPHTNSAEIKIHCDSWDGKSGKLGYIICNGLRDCILLDMTPGRESKRPAGYNILDQMWAWTVHNIGRYGTDADTVSVNEIARTGGNTLAHAVQNEMEHFDGERALHLREPVKVTAKGGEMLINPEGVGNWAPLTKTLVKRTRDGVTSTLARGTDYTEAKSGSQVFAINLTGAGAAQAGDVYTLSPNYHPNGEGFMFANLALVILNTFVRWNAQTVCAPIHMFKPSYDGNGTLGFALAVWKAPRTKNITDNANATGDPAFDGLEVGHWAYNPRNWNVVRGFLAHLPWDSVRYSGSVASGALTSDQAWCAVKKDGKWVYFYVNRGADVFTPSNSQAEPRTYRIYPYSLTTPTDREPVPTRVNAASALVVDVPPYSVVFAVQE